MKIPAAVGVTVKSTVAEDGSAIAPRSQVIVVVPEHVPWLGCVETKVKLAGRVSFRVTPVASCGPVFNTVAR